MKKTRLLPALTSALIVVFSSALADPTRFSGAAAVVRANVLGNQVALVDVGPLPAEGGADAETLLEYPVTGRSDPVNGALHAEVLHATTVAQRHQSRFEASVAEVSLTPAGNTISAGLLHARPRVTLKALAKSMGRQAPIKPTWRITANLGATIYSHFACQTVTPPLDICRAATSNCTTDPKASASHGWRARTQNGKPGAVFDVKAALLLLVKR